MSVKPSVIEIKDLSKRYILSHQEPYSTFRDTLANLVMKPLQLIRGKKPEVKEEFWALKDINVTIRDGERVGIIGRNGAGKSTLLKILSQITVPTTGNVKLKGRVASLLEVGTGFHPELTGRENIYLNGAILGMSRKEIDRKFDEIVAFSEIEKFLDTPVKRYSSGMYVRLAFSVAAHLDQEILIVDEVLAVGDAQFQKKCLSRLQTVTGEGRTVLFVSHNMSAISQLCDRVILLQNGKVVQDGPTDQVIQAYLAAQSDNKVSRNLTDPKLRRNSLPDSKVKWKAISVVNSKSSETDHIAYREPFMVDLELGASANVEDVSLGLAVESALGFPVFNTFQKEVGLPTTFRKGTHRFRLEIDPNLLSPGLYNVSLGANGPSVTDWIPSAAQFTVSSVGLSPEIIWDMSKGGIIYLPIKWHKK